MSELRQALSEINAIRAQVARGTEFRGYGPMSVAASGVLALMVAAVQTYGFAASSREPAIFLSIWVATAAVSVALTATETLARARRVHSGFALEMIHAALEQFLPCIAVGIALTAVATRAAREEIWMLPGLWGLVFGLGVFASCRFLPRQMFAVGVWYLIAGLASLMIASGPRTLMPWEMGISFGVGQLLVAAVLRYCVEESCAENH
jgi:hypothetical protein